MYSHTTRLDSCHRISSFPENVTVAFKRVDINVHMSFQGEEFNFLSVALPVQLRAGLNMKFWGHNVITSHKYYDGESSFAFFHMCHHRVYNISLSVDN